MTLFSMFMDYHYLRLEKRVFFLEGCSWFRVTPDVLSSNDWDPSAT